MRRLIEPYKPYIHFVVCVEELKYFLIQFIMVVKKLKCRLNMGSALYLPPCHHISTKLSMARFVVDQSAQVKLRH